MEAAREGHEEMVALLLAQGKRDLHLRHISEQYTLVWICVALFVFKSIYVMKKLEE